MSSAVSDKDARHNLGAQPQFWHSTVLQQLGRVAGKHRVSWFLTPKYMRTSRHDDEDKDCFLVHMTALGTTCEQSSGASTCVHLRPAQRAQRIMSHDAYAERSASARDQALGQQVPVVTAMSWWCLASTVAGIKPQGQSAS